MSTITCADAFVYTAVTANFIGANADTIVYFTQGAVGNVLSIAAAGFAGLTACQTNVFADIAINIIVDTPANLATFGSNGAGV